MKKTTKIWVSVALALMLVWRNYFRGCNVGYRLGFYEAFYK